MEIITGVERRRRWSLENKLRIDVVLEDEEIVSTVYQALSHRHLNSHCRGREGFPAEVVLRLLILKHVRNWELCGAGARSPGQSGVP